MKRNLKAGVAGLLALALVLGMIPNNAFATSETAEAATLTTKEKSPASYNLSDGGYLVSGNSTVTKADGTEVALNATNPVITTPGDYTIVTTTDDTVYTQLVSLYLLGDVNLDGTPGQAADASALNSLTKGKALGSAAEYAADLDNDETVSAVDMDLMTSIVDNTTTLDTILSQYHVPAVSYDFIGGDEVMPIIGFYGPYYGPEENGKTFDFLNDTTYQMVKDSGINIINYTINRIGDGQTNSTTSLKKAMELGEKYGIGYFVTDFDLNPERPADARASKTQVKATNIEFGSDAALSSGEVAEQIGQYSYFESYLGTNVSDEPYPNKYDAYYISSGNHTAGNNQLKYYDLSAKTMNQYTNNMGFVNTINPSNEAMYDNSLPYYYTYSSMLDEIVTAIDSKVLSYTSYPFSDGDILSDYANISDTTITKDSTITDYEHWAYYYQGLWETRAKAAEANIPFWTYVAAGGDWRDGSETTETVDAELPTEAETYWDVNNKLAFGAKGIEWFTALQPWYFSLEGDGNDYDRNGLIGNDGTPTPFYWYAQNINNHIAAIDHVLMKSNSTGIMAIGDETVKMVQSGIMDESNALLASTDMLTNISGGGSLGAIVGCFDYKDTEAFYVVNQSVDETQEFTLTFADEYAYEYHVNTKKYNGYGSTLTLSIAPGEGVLVVLDEVSGFLAEPTVASNVYYDVEVLADEALIMHNTAAGGTAFLNLPDYLKGLYYLRTSTFTAVEATFIADCYAYVLASEELVADLKTQGFKCVASYAKADIMTGYWAGKDNVSATLYLMEKQVEYGETITYGNGTNWGTLMTSLTKLNVTVEDLLADISGDEDIKIAQMADGVALRASSGSGTFQNLPSYLNGLYFVQHNGNWPESVTATAKTDCYFYVIASDTYVTNMTDQGFKLVDTLAKATIINGWMSCSDTLYLFEKQMNWGESITYSSSYRSNSIGGWGTLITTPTKLETQGFLASLSADTGSCAIGQIKNGATVMTGQAAVYQNLPDYLNGLSYTMNSTWQTVTATALTDCYFYVITSDTYVTNMTNQGFKLVDTLAKATIINGWMSCSDTLYLFEKQVDSGEQITYYATYRSSGAGGWGTLLTSVNKLDIPANGLRVSVSGPTYTTGQLETGAILLHTNSNGDTAFTNVPEYLNGLYYAQVLDTSVVTATATMDSYVYLLADEDLVSSLQATGFTRVAAYEKTDILSGYWANNSAFSSTLYLMEMYLEQGQSVTYGDGSNIVSLMTSPKKLEIPLEDYNGLLATLVADTGTCAVGKLANGATVMTGQAAVYQNLPDYLIGLDYTMNSTWQTVKATAITDCYFYVIASAANGSAMTDQDFKLVSNLSKATIINGWMSCSDTLYLFEKQMKAGEEITYYATYLTSGTGGWGTLMTSIDKLEIPVDSSMISAGCVTDPEQLYSVVRMENSATIIHSGLAGNTAFHKLPEYLEGLYFVQPRGIYEMKAAPKVEGYAYILTHEALVDNLKTKGFAEVASYAKEDIITPFGFYYDTAFSDTLYLMERQVACGEEITYGSTSYSATYIFSNERLAISNEAKVIGNTVTLDGALDVNYYVNKGTAKKLSLKFTMEDGSVLTVSDNSYDEAKNAYVFTYSLPAKHMTDNVKARLFDGSYCVGEYEFSIQKYSEKLLLRSDVSDEIKTLVKNMLHYGAYVQQYFSYNTSILANDGLEALDLSGVTQSTLESYKAGSVVESDFGTIVGANLNLKSETVLNLYIQPKDGINVDDFIFKCGETTLTKGTYKGLIMVTVSGIAANELDTIFEIQAVSSDSTTYTFKYSVFTYAYNALSDSYTGRTGLKDMIKAMYQYNRAAKEVQ